MKQSVVLLMSIYKYIYIYYAFQIIQLARREHDQTDAFQLKAFRHLLNIPPAHVDRSWRNQRGVDSLWQAQK